MTKSALEAILNEYGSKVKVIMGTGFKLFLNHAKNPQTITNDMITFKTFGSVDFLIYPDFDGFINREVLIPVSDVIKIITADSDVYDPYRY